MQSVWLTVTWIPFQISEIGFLPFGIWVQLVRMAAILHLLWSSKQRRMPIRIFLTTQMRKFSLIWSKSSATLLGIWKPQLCSSRTYSNSSTNSKWPLSNPHKIYTTRKPKNLAQKWTVYWRIFLKYIYTILKHAYEL